MCIRLHPNDRALAFYLRPKIMTADEFIEFINNFVPAGYEDDRMSRNEIERLVYYLLEPERWMYPLALNSFRDYYKQIHSLQDDFHGMLNLNDSGNIDSWHLKFNFDDENIDIDFSTEDEFPYITVTCYGDGQPEFCFFIYISDDNLLSVYIPTRGNTWVSLKKEDEGLTYRGVVTRYDGETFKNEWGYDYCWDDVIKSMSRSDFNNIVTDMYDDYDGDIEFESYIKLVRKYLRTTLTEISKLKDKGKTEIVQLIGEVKEKFMEFLEYEVELDLTACKEEFFRVSHPE